MFNGWSEFYYQQSTPSSGKLILSTETGYYDTDPTNIIRYTLDQVRGKYDAYAPPPNQTYWGSTGGPFFDPNIVEYGVGLWPTKPTFNPATPESNFWTPEVLASQSEVVLANCRWLWFFDQNYSFYNGIVGALPAAYVTQIWALRAQLGMPA
jgi:hypothetical protein